MWCSPAKPILSVAAEEDVRVENDPKHICESKRWPETCRKRWIAKESLPSGGGHKCLESDGKVAFEKTADEIRNTAAIRK